MRVWRRAIDWIVCHSNYKYLHQIGYLKYINFPSLRDKVLVIVSVVHTFRRQGDIASVPVLARLPFTLALNAAWLVKWQR